MSCARRRLWPEQPATGVAGAPAPSGSSVALVSCACGGVQCLLLFFFITEFKTMNRRQSSHRSGGASAVKQPRGGCGSLMVRNGSFEDIPHHHPAEQSPWLHLSVLVRQAGPSLYNPVEGINECPSGSFSTKSKCQRNKQEQLHFSFCLLPWPLHNLERFSLNTTLHISSCIKYHCWIYNVK